MKKAFAPIVNQHSRILILGTMPGEKSLELQQYYGHRGNHFWPIMFSIFNRPFTTDYTTRINLLLENNIALWDVLSHCERIGSADSNIQNEVVNNFKAFYRKHPTIKAIYWDSLTAEKLYRKHVGLTTGMRYYQLPSPSGAYASMNLATKTEKWSVILGELK
ncbi:MAG TPA: DNA-deoxyinosine glycosylase [Chitinophagales bacterium]|nr:DNA-deoxyinosine glycosylase [Chitinophagales bacterium]